MGTNMKSKSVLEPKVLLRMARTEFEGRSRIVGLWRTHGKRQGLPWALAYPAVDELNQRHGTNVKIIGPHLAEHAVCEGGEVRRTLDFGYYFLVDEALFTGRLEKPLGKSIVAEFKDKKGNKYRSTLISTGKYEGETGIALVVIGLSTADFSVDIPEIGSGKLVELLQKVSLDEIVGKLRRIREIAIDVPDSRLIKVPNFKFWGSNWERLHPETMIPYVGEGKGPQRRLCSSKGRPVAGPVVRGVGSFGYGAREDMINAQNGISVLYGVVLEIPEADIEKFKIPGSR